MAEITAQAVRELRERTDLPMMECKQALAECGGDMEKAIEWLRKKHKGKLADRAGKATGEGRIGLFIDQAKKVGALIELQCETAPVAKNDVFIDLANAFARKVAMGSAQSPNPDDIRKDPELDAKFTEVFGKLREAMNLAQCRRITGACLAGYVHHDGKSAVISAMSAVPKSDKNIGGDLCMHALFTKPIAIDRASVPKADVDRVHKEAVEIAKAEKKPENLIEKIAAGRVNAFYAERVLLEQLHVKTDDYGKQTVGAVLKAAGVDTVTDLAIMTVGGK